MKLHKYAKRRDQTTSPKQNALNFNSNESACLPVARSAHGIMVYIHLKAIKKSETVVTKCRWLHRLLHCFIYNLFLITSVSIARLDETRHIVARTFDDRLDELYNLS